MYRVIIFLVFLGLIACPAGADVIVAADGSGTYVGGLQYVSSNGAYVMGTPMVNVDGIYTDGIPKEDEELKDKMERIRLLIEKLKKTSRKIEPKKASNSLHASAVK